MTDIKTLNDNLRKHLIGGKIVLTMEIKALKLRWLCFFDFIFCFFRINNSPTFSF